MAAFNRLFRYITNASTAATAPRPGGVLGRLARDERGATLAMMAAVTIPMIGMVGGAVDASRLYLVKTRLQQACDAGALAARRVMGGSTLVASDRTQATKFFQINLREGAYGSNNATFDVVDVLENAQPSGKVRGNASVNVPMTLMKVFGKSDVVLNATCEAQLNIANNDIMFVLDVTGSMSCLPTDSTGTCGLYAVTNVSQQADGTWKTTEKTGSRIDGLREAVIDFYNTIKAATASTSRLRVGFVPYSSGVNVGGIIQDVNSTAIRSTTWDYQSRMANFNTVNGYTTNVGTPVVTTEIYGSPTNITSTNCDRYGDNLSFSGFNPSPSGTPTTTGGTGSPVPSTRIVRSYTNNPTAGNDWGYPGSTPTTGTTRKCRRTVTTTTTTYTATYSLTNWTYDRKTYNLAAYIAGTQNLGVPTASTRVATSGSYTPQQLAALAGTTSLTTVASAWTRKCVEEPTTGRDDIHHVPSSDATRWVPTWDRIVYQRSGEAAQTTTNDNVSPNYQASGQMWTGSSVRSPVFTCPKAARRLAVMTQQEVSDYVDETLGFVAHGYTYHDLGMVWGARLMSTTGFFAADHGAAPNGKPVLRHIIFMTDGQMEPSTTAYSTFGIEQYDKRMIGAGTMSDANLATVHNTRFAAACTAAKAAGISVWVVSFATALSTELTNCADPGQAFAATSTTELKQKFQAIATKIAELRLAR